jgi:CDP-6-deoxy-D-xylo-4-hexulose-3-dehydrase
MTTRPARRRLPDPGAVHDEREIDAVVGALRESNLAIGERVDDFEHRVAVLLAKRHGVMVNSGSSALRLAIDLLDLAPSDEVITPVVTFATDVAPLVQSGIVPAFVDVEPDTYQIDVDGIDEMVGPRTRAILAPNLVGNVPDWDRIREVADAHDLTVVEDSCDVRRGCSAHRRAPTSGDDFAPGPPSPPRQRRGCRPDDDGLLDRCLTLRRWGRRSETYLFGSRKGEKDRFGPLADGTPYDLVFLFEAIGYNFEPSEIGAAYGLVQLDKLADYNDRRRYNWQRLDDFFAANEDKVVRPRSREDAQVTWMRYPFELREGLDRTAIQRELESRGIATLMVWTGNVLRQPGFAAIEHRAPAGGFPNADRVMDRALSLPCHHALTSDDVGFMIESLADVLAD